MKIRRSNRATRARGFTLMELIVVIVVIGVLASVAMPSMTGVTIQARLATQQATLGALKSAWSAVFARTGTTPTCEQVAAQMLDPACSASSATITCEGVMNKDALALAQFTCTALTLVKPSDLKCDATAGC